MPQSRMTNDNIENDSSDTNTRASFLERAGRGREDPPGPVVIPLVRVGRITGDELEQWRRELTQASGREA